MPTKIEWATETWNPITGCTPVSEGCANCYANRMATRLRGRCGYPADDPFRVTFHPERLEQPLKWKKPKMVFVCSMGDLFHEGVPDQWLCRVLETMFKNDRHTYMVLTKRPMEMKEFLSAWYSHDWLQYNPHVWLGVTAENQQRADERIPVLLQIPAAVRFVSVEPMLGQVDVSPYLENTVLQKFDGGRGFLGGVRIGRGLDWVICGGETGPGARPMHPDWARSLRDQCQAAMVPFFFKQWGEWRAGESKDFCKYLEDTSTGQYMVRVGKKHAGRLLDGCEWNEMPMVEESTK